MKPQFGLKDLGWRCQAREMGLFSYCDGTADWMRGALYY
jgi:hypothetical protein